MSTQPCGCDPEVSWTCETHAITYKTYEERLEDRYKDGPTVAVPCPPSMQSFDTGATRSADAHKPDFEGFLNPLVLSAFGEYMHLHRTQRDGRHRDSDNWQKGIPLNAYMKSLVRHVFDLWRMHRGYGAVNPDDGRPFTKSELCCAILFNVMGYLKETLDPSPINKERT